jgi:competence protein ComEA
MSLNGPSEAHKVPWYRNGWTVAAALLALIIIIGGIFIWSGHSRGPGLEISLATEKSWDGQICVSGAINAPGLYPYHAGDTIADILRAAGGVNANADTARLELNVPGRGESAVPQKVDINRAEAWLMAALPGIGAEKAQGIIDYRREHGGFRDIYEIMKVPGIGETIFANIEGLITVGE